MFTQRPKLWIGAGIGLLVLLLLATLFSRYLATNLSQTLTETNEALVGGKLKGELPSGEHTLQFIGTTQNGQRVKDTTTFSVSIDEPEPTPSPSPSGSPEPSPSPSPSPPPSFEVLDLPAWYEQERLQLHSQFGAQPSYLVADFFYHRASRFEEMGAPPVAVIGIKRESHLGAWWQSSVGSILQFVIDTGRDIAQELIDDLHNGGRRAIIYYRHATDRREAETHPDWRCLDLNGEEQTHNPPPPYPVPPNSNNVFMSLSSPYADFMQTRLVELAQRGADGFYFDYTHQPTQGCFDTYTKEAFTAATGQPPPTTKNKSDPVFRQFIGFQAQVIEDTLADWKQAIKSVNDDAVVIISANLWPRLTIRHLTGRLFQIADSTKTEFDLAALPGGVYPQPTNMRARPTDVKIALGYAMARDAADGRPPHVWFYRPSDINAEAMRYAAAGIMTHGGIVNLHIEPLPSPAPLIPNPTTIPLYQPAFELGSQVSAGLAGTRPIKWAAVHFNERFRDQHASSDADMWQYANYPFFSLFEVLFRERVPVGVITDSQLDDGELDGYDVLVLPAPNDLTPAQQAHVATFKQQGGRVIGNRPEWQWHLDTGYEPARQDFLSRLGNRINKAPVRVYGGPATLHAVSFQAPSNNNRRLIALANDFIWAEEPDPTLPPPATGVSIFLRRQQLPAQVRDIVSGQTLTASPSGTGFSIEVPPFEAMALVEVIY